MFPINRNYKNLTLDELEAIIPILKTLTGPLNKEFESITKSGEWYTLTFGSEGGFLTRKFRIENEEAVDIESSGGMF